jgi:secondary thiamine-phosphate synthase enzyme
MNIKQQEITFMTIGRGTQDITSAVNQIIADAAINTGICHLLLKHTSASLIINENYDIQVREDLENFISRLIPDGDPLFKHTIEGEDDMPAHIRTILTQTEMTLPVTDGKLVLGTWQGIYLYEHRYATHQRHIYITLMGQ